MSEDKISLEFLTARVGALTDRMHDFELRFASLEARFSVFEHDLVYSRHDLAHLSQQWKHALTASSGGSRCRKSGRAACWPSWCGWLSARGCRQKAADNESLS